jgi:probable DNA metabolism protein
MISFQYDGTFEGLLTVIATAIDENSDVQEISSAELQADLFTEVRSTLSDPDLAAGFFERLRMELSPELLLDIGYCFLSEIKGIEKDLLDYIRLLLKEGEQVNGNYSDPVILKVRRTCQKVSYEILRMQGLIRFRKLSNGVYYAPIAPEHNVIRLLASHFRDRFADQQWLIHDTRRKKGIAYDKRRVRFLPWLEMTQEIESSSLPYSLERHCNLWDPDERDYQKIWNQYFQSIAIKERQNKKLQRRHMPERYWQYLVERVMEVENEIPQPPVRKLK